MEVILVTYDAIYIALANIPNCALLPSTEPLRQHPRIQGTIPLKKSDHDKRQMRGKEIPSLPSKKVEDRSFSLGVKY